MPKSSLDILFEGIQPAKQKKIKKPPLYETYNKFSEKQKAMLNAPLKRINIAEGAVRSGKTFITMFLWCKFVQSLPGDASVIMVGKTLTTLKRNVLDDLIKIAGSDNFKFSLSKKEGMLYGRTVYLEGADDESAESKIRGLTVAGALADELTLMPKSFFTMLLSRLSIPGAALIGTTNPDRPTHWLHKEYLQNPDIDLARWRFCMDDNPSLEESYKENLKKEYTGILYDRMILGKWVGADGTIYRNFNLEIHVKSREWYNEFIKTHPIMFSAAGGDVGGNRSASTMYNTAFTRNFEYLIVTEEYYNSKNENTEQIIGDYVACGKRWRNMYKCREMYIDSAESLIVKSVKGKLPIYVSGSLKTKIKDRIRFEDVMFQRQKLIILDECPKLIEAFSEAVWDSRQDEDVRLDDFSVNIDSLDGVEYSFEKYMNRIMRR